MSKLTKKEKLNKAKMASAESAAQVSSDALNSKILKDKNLLKKSIRELENKIINMASDFNTDKGQLIGYKTNLAQAQKIHADLQTIFKDTYGKASINSVKGYNNIAKVIKSNLKEMGEAASFTGVDKTMIEALQNQSLDQYAVYGQQAQQKIISSMYNSVISKGNFASLVESISSVLTGSLSTSGVPMEVYAEQWANDGIMNFHQDVLNKKGEQAGLTSFLYVGNIMLTTRDFCKQRVGKVYTKEQIDSWDNQKWQGKSGPAMTHRGGYNCRHHWQPVDPEWAEGIEPKQVIKPKPVVPKSGEYVPTKKEIKAIQGFSAMGGPDAAKHPFTNEMGKVLDALVDKQKGLHSPVTVYRGMSFNEKEWGKIWESWSTEGEKHNFKMLTSFSKDERRVLGYGSGGDTYVKLKITSDSGFDITKWSLYSEEQEVIFPKNFKFKIKDPDFMKGEGGSAWYIEIEEI